MLTSAEALFGPYPWGRFDLLVLPPSFPYGGMENPRLTFLTPTLLTGDRSLVNVVAHELSHSWTGNLVSNATAEDFWLNEGFTVFAERRILEVLEGPEMVALHAAVGRQALDEAVANFRDRPELHPAAHPTPGVDPDDAFSQVPYEKGYLFLRALEDAVGRAAFDRFLKPLHGRVPVPVGHDRGAARAGPDGAARSAGGGERAPMDRRRGSARPAPRPPGAAGWSRWRGSGRRPRHRRRGTGRPWEWQVYLNQLPRPSPPELMTTLEERFHLTEAPIRRCWWRGSRWRFAVVTRRRCAGPRRCSARSAG